MLEDTYLTQRLKAPNGRSMLDRVFGGHMIQMTDKGWSVLNQICSLDYMGAAEYEFATLNDTMRELVEAAHAGDLTSFCFVLSPFERELNSSRRWTKNPLPAAKYVRVFGICDKARLEEIQERVRILVAKPNAFFIKRGSFTGRAFDPLDEHDDVQGWIEHDNRFLFFASEEMWTNFCSILGVTPCELPDLPERPDYRAMRKPQLVEAAMQLKIWL